MKKIVTLSVKGLLLLFICVPLLVACNRSERPAPDALDRDTSYAFGMLVAAQMGFAGISFDYHAFMEGFRDFNEAREMRLTQDQAMQMVIAALTMVEARNEEELLLLAEANLQAGEAYMASNAQRSGVVTTASGLQYEVIVQGGGERPVFNDTVLVHYEGTLIDGTVFDSSFQRGEPVDFPVGAVIQGWIEGLQLMNVGSTYRFVIPADLAYGTWGAGPIPPNATLIFIVELLDILR
jgi:FKBP-type peptidyl-prolyl cis-trans isomerase